MTRSAISSRTSAPALRWKPSSSNVEKLPEEEPGRLQAVRPGRATARWRGLGQAQHQRVAPSALAEGDLGHQGRHRHVAALLPKPDSGPRETRDREAFRA